MIGHSVPEYIFIRICITGLRLIAPLSILYLIACLYTNTWILSPWIAAYAFVEAAFYLLVYLPRSWYLQKAAVHPPRLSEEERKALFSRCFARVRDTDQAAGWFFASPPHEIFRDNIAEWLLWALFSSDRNGREEWEDEIEQYIQAMEKLMGHKFKTGWNESVGCMKVSMDPVVSLHRPFIWYLIISIVDTYTTILLACNGFIPYLQHDWHFHFPPHVLAHWARKAPTDRLSYWYRPHRSKTKHPILLLHGIGIGLWTYVPFLLEIVKEDPEVGIIAIENLPISMRMSPPPLDRFAMLDAITKILDYHELPNVVVASHSYGTITAAHMFKDAKLQKRIAASLFIDPITFLLHLPSVAFNFLYREPKTANEWQLWYFASRDPDIARCLSRHFFWIENVLWKEELKDRRVGVVLSGRDQIVDSIEVWRYLTGEADKDPEFRWATDNLEILYYPDLDHSKVFDTAEQRRPLVEMIGRFVETKSTSNDAKLTKRHRSSGPLLQRFPTVPI
ncbi:unnamed protein product [Somion occarium]|uniref:AB hydrolase-1 domain-containing protein n=1 Tax=Somion occarium TaxID=3059160 RepID=A0ABP1CFY9_9APHY